MSPSTEIEDFESYIQSECPNSSSNNMLLDNLLDINLDFLLSNSNDDDSVFTKSTQNVGVDLQMENRNVYSNESVIIPGEKIQSFSDSEYVASISSMSDTIESEEDDAHGIILEDLLISHDDNLTMVVLLCYYTSLQVKSNFWT